MFEERKEWANVVASRGWQLKVIRINTDKGRCPLRLGEEMSNTCYSIAWKLEI